MQWAMNQIGNSKVKAKVPAPGYTSNMIPVITLNMPAIKEITGPRPTYRSTWIYRIISAMPMMMAATP